MTGIDTDWVRAQFPNMAAADFAGRIFAENAGGSFACRPVIERLTRFYTERKVQPYAGYPASAKGGAEMDEARRGMARMLGVAGDELSFGPSTTQNVYVLAQAFRGLLSPGDAIVVTDQDHEANSGPWRRLAEAGIEIREWRLDPDSGRLDPAGLRTLLDGRVRLVCFPHCSNVIGEINDVKAIAALVHEAGAVCCVDGVSYAPHGFPDVGEIGADIYLFSSYKTYGPHQGIMVVRRELAERLPNQGHAFNGGVLYKRLTPAGPDHAQVAACAGMVDYVDAFAGHHGLPDARAVHDAFRAHETALVAPLVAQLSDDPRLRLLGPQDAGARAPTLAFTTDRSPRDVAGDLQAEGVCCDAGDFYARRPLEAVGIDPDRGVVRISLVHYNTASEVDRVMAALDRCL